MAEPKTTRTTKTAGKHSRSRASKSPQMLKSFNPQTGEVMGEIAAAAPAEVADAVAQARKVAPEWAAIPVEGRVRILREIRYRIYELMDEIVETVAAETGKPKREALITDVFGPIFIFQQHEKAAARALRTQRIGGALSLLWGVKSTIEWRPFGVVGCITPWNYPIANSFLGITAPLFAGNTIVVKPSEVTPACGELLRKILDPLPSGVATIVQGGGDVGAALVDVPVDKISFIGSPPTGRKICEAAAKHLTPVVMELGGKDAAIVLEDADIESASAGLLWGSFFNSGQTCLSVERIYVVDEVADRFKDQLLGKLAKVEQDDSGSLTFSKQLEIVQDQVTDAVEKGATLLAGGPDAGPRNENGTLFFAPTVIENVNDEMKVLKEETFGPVVTITRVRDEEEAIRRANTDAVNLTASVWTGSKHRAQAVAERLIAGGVTSNEHGTLPGSAWGPWGGYGESGFGRLNGVLGIREFAVPTHVSHSLAPKTKKLWWFPYDDDTEAAWRGLAGVFGERELPAKVGHVKDVVAAYGKALKNKL
ncbi:MAG: aldehyde dehydrogenase family protein [Actinomycetota bacterium]